MLDPPVLPYRPVYARCAAAASEVAIDCACDASIAAPFACAIASLRLLCCLSCAACSWRTASASRVRASGPMLPRRMSMKSDTARTLDCAAKSA